MDSELKTKKLLWSISTTIKNLCTNMLENDHQQDIYDLLLEFDIMKDLINLANKITDIEK